MKTILLGLILMLGLGACGNGKDNEAIDTESGNTPAIENVNGPIPDTTNTITLDQQGDTAQRDTGGLPR